VLPLYVPRDVSAAGPRRSDLEASYAHVFAALGTTPPYGLPGCGSAGVRTWLAFEGAAQLAHHLDDVERWVMRGVRSFGLVHSYDNVLAGSATGETRAGLSAAGRALTRRIYAAGAFVDVSHASERTLDDVVAIAGEFAGPVVATHSNVRALADHPRNLSAAQLRAIARTGGVVGINFHAPYLARGRAATLDDVVEHIRYAVRVAGARHVALGSDFEGDVRPPPQLSSVAKLPHLARALLDAGFGASDVRAVLADNALRLLCPKVAAARRAPP
jgi:membrane dipeptidase